MGSVTWEPSLPQLERLNAIIDLCIDNELYDQLSSFLKVDLSRWTDNKKLPAFNQDNPAVLDVATLDNLIDPFQGLIHGKPAKPCSKDNLRVWFQLFWAKAVRAELKKRNYDLYDDLLAFLENSVPFIGTQEAANRKKRELAITALNFLMELSALREKPALDMRTERES